MNKAEIKDKLRNLIRELLLLNLRADREIPETISNYFLENCSLINGQKVDTDDLNDFTLQLHKYIEDKHLMSDSVVAPDVHDVSLDSHKFLEAELEYDKVTGELVSMLSDILKVKDKYSEHFKDQCKAQETSVDVIRQKCEFFKKQLFLKLYGEGNALSGHLALRDLLRKELDSLRREYGEVVELNRRYDEIKNDETFQDLFRKYRELRKIQERTDIVNEMLPNLWKTVIFCIFIQMLKTVMFGSGS